MPRVTLTPEQKALRDYERAELKAAKKAKQPKKPSKPRKKKLTQAQLEQRSEAGKKGGAARAAVIAEDNARRERGDLTWEEEVAYFGAGFEKWRKRCIEERNFDPVGFYPEMLSGKYEVNSETLGGDGVVGLAPFVPIYLQRLWIREIIWHRWAATDDAGWDRYRTEFPEVASKFGRPRGRFMRLVCKGRRAYMTTNNVMIAIADGTINSGANAAMTSFDVKEGLKTLGSLLRTTLGDSKKAAAGAKTMNDQDFKTSNRSVVRLLSPGSANMGKGFSYNYLLWTEADYIEDLSTSLRSVLPSIRKGPFACVVMESTVDRNSATGFKDYLERTVKGETAFRIYFQPWWWDKTARMEVSELDRKALDEGKAMKGSDGYEFKTLRDELHLSDEQIVWWRQRFLEDADCDLESMREQYPSKIEEILESRSDRAMFSKDAISFYEGNVRDPVQRFVASYTAPGNLREFQDHDSVRDPHVEIWYPPEYGAKYRIGADCADSEDRESEDGSENFAVLIDEDDGRVCAIWHGYCSSTDFALVLSALHHRYNEAAVIPEWNNAGKAVITALMDSFGVTNIYKRQSFGKVIRTVQGLYGFETRGNTRGVLIDQLQTGINNLLFDIPSKALLQHVVTFGKNKGRKARRRGKSSIDPDDGAIALALTTFGHDNLVKGIWRPKQAFRETVITPQAKPRRRGFRIESEPERKKRWDPVWNCFR